MYQDEIKQLLNQIAWIDDITFHHSLEVGYLMAQFVETAEGKSFLKQAWVTRNEAVVAALLHDTGKTLWPFDLLFSEEKLKDMQPESLKEIWTHIIAHPLSSQDIVLRQFEKTGNRFWQRIAQGVAYHHENYAGGGYPYNLVGVEIPLLARGLRVMDNYSVLTSVNRYRREPLEPSKAIKEMKSWLGWRYDPYWGSVIVSFLEEINKSINLDEWLEQEMTQNL